MLIFTLNTCQPQIIVQMNTLVEIKSSKCLFLVSRFVYCKNGAGAVGFRHLTLPANCKSIMDANLPIFWADLIKKISVGIRSWERGCLMCWVQSNFGGIRPKLFLPEYRIEKPLNCHNLHINYLFNQNFLQIQTQTLAVFTRDLPNWPNIWMLS